MHKNDIVDYLMPFVANALFLHCFMATEARHRYAVTVGFFDGVHKGHRFLIDTLKETACKYGLLSQIVTFAEHPRQILQSDYVPLLISTPEDKIRMLKETGADLCTTLHFTPEMASKDARTFMADILQKELGADLLLVGHDHRFGHDNISNFETYREIGTELGLKVLQAEALMWKDKPVSSSRIRSSLSLGNVFEATEMLGYCYSISGTVVHGLKNGRKIGFPTANLGPHCELLQIPANGVYAAWADIDGKRYKSMLNIGFRPTISSGEERRTIEAHLLNFNRDIYGQELRLSFVEYIRPERRFESLEALAAQLSADRRTVSDTLTL